jgi:PAS domain S-box-containing protein
VAAGEAALGEALVVLDPVPRSARYARALVRRLLVDGQRSGWLDSAELAVSEVVTNALQHAHTQIELRAVLTASTLRVEVRDSSPVMPVARDWGAEAPTGRGMSLVAAVTTSHGVIPLQPHGKTVWFTLGDEVTAPQPDATALLDAYDDEPTSHRVVLAAFPPALWLAAREHHDAVLRDLALHVVTHPSESVSTEQQAQADLARLTVSASLDAALADLPTVPESLDLAVVVPGDRRECFPVLKHVLDEAERFAAAGELLVRPALPEVVAVRDWVCEQVLGQTEGATSSPWAGAEAPWFAEAPSRRLPPAWDAAQVVASTASLVAADDANRILAVSASFAAAVGWDPDELVGKRLVTLIPARLREAHVAGFTRYLATGQRRVIGHSVEVSVLAADGRELPATLLIEERYAPDGRTVLLAELDVRPDREDLS